MRGEHGKDLAARELAASRLRTVRPLPSVIFDQAALDQAILEQAPSIGWVRPHVDASSSPIGLAIARYRADTARRAQLAPGTVRYGARAPKRSTSTRPSAPAAPVRSSSLRRLAGAVEDEGGFAALAFVAPASSSSRSTYAAADARSPSCSTRRGARSSGPAHVRGAWRDPARLHLCGHGSWRHVRPCSRHQLGQCGLRTTDQERDPGGLTTISSRCSAARE